MVKIYYFFLQLHRGLTRRKLQVYRVNHYTHSHRMTLERYKARE